MSTHFLDEADALSDRVAILQEGRVQCFGSSMFLKGAYQVGYQLNVETAGGDDAGHSKVLKLAVAGRIPEAEVVTDAGKEVTFRLPTSRISAFPALLDDLERMREEGSGSVVAYGVGVTTLETIFTMLEVGAAREDGASKPQPDDDLEDVLIEKMAPPPADRSDPTFGVHFKAMMAKRFNNAKRDRKSFLLGNLVPVLLNCLGFLLALVTSTSEEMGSVTLKLSQQNPDITPSQQNPIYFNGVDTTASLFQCGGPTFCSWASPPNACGQDIYPTASTTCAFVASALDPATFLPSDAQAVVEPSVTTVAEVSELLQTTRSGSPASRYGALSFAYTEPSTIDGSGASFTTTVSDNCKATRGTSDPSCQYFGHWGYTVHTNFTAKHGSVLYQAVADELLLRAVVGNANAELTPTVYPLKFTKNQKEISNGADAFIAWFLIVVSFPFILSSFATFIVREREQGSKHLQKISGVWLSAYWAANAAWDMASYLVTVSAIIGLMFAFNADGLTTTSFDIVYGIITLLYVFGPAAAAFTYMTTFFFKSPSSAQGFTIIFNFLAGLAGPLACLILIIVDTGNKDLVDVIAWCLRWIPAFSLGHGILFSINAANLQGYVYGAVDSVFSGAFVTYDLGALIVAAVAYAGLVFVTDKYDLVRRVQDWQCCGGGCRCSKCKRGSGEEAALPSDIVDLELDASGATSEYDPEVSEQVSLVRTAVASLASGEGSAPPNLIVDDLTKRYKGGKVAVDGLSLLVGKEVFGLLGVNGAGKTSLIKVRTSFTTDVGPCATSVASRVSAAPPRFARSKRLAPVAVPSRRRLGHFRRRLPQGKQHLQRRRKVQGRRRLLPPVRRAVRPHDRPRAPAALRTAEGRRRPRVRRRGQALRAGDLGGGRGQAHFEVLRRDEEEGIVRRGQHRAARSRLPRRAQHRHGPRFAAQDVAVHIFRRRHRRAHDALDGGVRGAVRQAHDHGGGEAQVPRVSAEAQGQVRPRVQGAAQAVAPRTAGRRARRRRRGRRPRPGGRGG